MPMRRRPKHSIEAHGTSNAAPALPVGDIQFAGTTSAHQPTYSSQPQGGGTQGKPLSLTDDSLDSASRITSRSESKYTRPWTDPLIEIIEKKHVAFIILYLIPYAASLYLKHDVLSFDGFIAVILEGTVLNVLYFGVRSLNRLKG